MKEKEIMNVLSKGEKVDYQLGETWVDLFHKQVRLHPDHTAVVAENGSLSYSELNNLSDRLAAALIEKKMFGPRMSSSSGCGSPKPL